MFGQASETLVALNRDNNRRHAEKALALCFVTQYFALGAEVLKGIWRHDPEFLGAIESIQGDKSWSNMVCIAQIEEHCGSSASAFDWYLRALHVLETTRAKMRDTEERRRFLDVIYTAELFAGLARLCVGFSKPGQPSKPSRSKGSWTFHGPTWVDEALLFLEQGRARVLLDMLTPEGVSEDFLEWTYQMRQAELVPEPAQVASHGEDEDAETYLSKLSSDLQMEAESVDRAIILQEFHTPHFRTDLATRYSAISDGTVVVHINPSRQGTLILYITHDGIELAHSSLLTDQQMERQVLGYLKPFKHVATLGLPPKQTCNDLLQGLSREIVTPGNDIIARKAHVIFVPTLSLNRFPFSALLFKDRPLFLEKAVSMVPSLSVLQRLMERERGRTHGSSSGSKNCVVIYRAPLREQTVPLNISAAAAIDISQKLACKLRAAHETDADSFKRDFEVADVMLIGTHGSQSEASAWRSNIRLQKEFPVVELVRLQGWAALVVFEACMSGVGESSGGGSDVLGFAHSVLSSGASAFLGALWEVSDKASALLISFFFGELTATAGAPCSLASCWRKAQAKLYHTDTAAAVAVLEGFRSVLRGLGVGLVKPRHLERILDTLDRVIRDEDESVDYSHPFYWAPFTLVGHSGLCLQLSKVE
ncbi:CHAT domain-containing protein [Microdochium trichocladiopsis]|uniref:CHAT domain-containing protein n=1 Tax=Microdochium trichocladiopsis TaxID=1682393 RepID=A0A9P8XSL2_9PEZI|nr:CHAT domain-containing protein [Microdochium trichocladiopsis]KAH7009342.1 CHAT domain-containing protein [Microdochium trichocladiopsis]